MGDDPRLLRRGLLLAIIERRGRFPSYGEAFHQAYGEALRVHDDVTTRQALEDFDPVFGVYAEAEAMLLEGLSNLIITLESPRDEIAVRRISATQATKELNELPNSLAYRLMAARFNEVL